MSYMYNKENVLILNTPKRNELLKNGLPAKHKMRSNILGRGTFGTVFKAIYREQPVAVKIIKKQSFDTLLNEMHILHWEHANIIKILKVESTPNFGLIIMERFHGQCLQSVLDNIKLSITHRVWQVETNARKTKKQRIKRTLL